MTLAEVIKQIEAVASAQPAINMIVENDIFRLNTIKPAQYGVFGFTQGQHTGNTENDFISYAFTLFYVDRLVNGKYNEIDIQSTGVSVLDNIIRTLAELGFGVQPYTFQSFNQRFTDECAGVYSSVTIEVPRGSLCVDEFDGGREVPIY